MLSLGVETFEMRQHLLTISLARLRKNTKAILKTYEWFICGDMHYTAGSFCKIMLKQQHPSLGCELHFLGIVPIIIGVPYIVIPVHLLWAMMCCETVQSGIFRVCHK
jgi:hypothetical protein